MMGNVPANVGRRLIIVLVATFAVAGAVSTPASAATWIGTTHGKASAANRWVSGGADWHGNFWFSTGRGGSVHGYAIVGYEPSIDVGGLNNMINYIKGIAGLPLGILGPYAPAAGAIGLGNIIGVAVSFHEGMAIRQGPLSGSIGGGRLTLRWGAKPKGIPYDIVFQLVSGNKRIGGGTFGLHDPFQGSARLLGGRQAVKSSESKGTAKGVARQVGSYWVAHRVG